MITHKGILKETINTMININTLCKTTIKVNGETIRECNVRNYRCMTTGLH